MAQAAAKKTVSSPRVVECIVDKGKISQGKSDKTFQKAADMLRGFLEAAGAPRGRYVLHVSRVVRGSHANQGVRISRGGEDRDFNVIIQPGDNKTCWKYRVETPHGVTAKQVIDLCEAAEKRVEAVANDVSTPEPPPEPAPAPPPAEPLFDPGEFFRDLGLAAVALSSAFPRRDSTTPRKEVQELIAETVPCSYEHARQICQALINGGHLKEVNRHGEQCVFLYSEKFLEQFVLHCGHVKREPAKPPTPPPNPREQEHEQLLGLRRGDKVPPAPRPVAVVVQPPKPEPPMKPQPAPQPTGSVLPSDLGTRIRQLEEMAGRVDQAQATIAEIDPALSAVEARRERLVQEHEEALRKLQADHATSLATLDTEVAGLRARKEEAVRILTDPECFAARDQLARVQAALQL